MRAHAGYDPVGPRDDRMEQRVSSSDKRMIEQAAALQGLKASEFVTSAAVQAARETLARLASTILQPQDADAILRAFDDTAPKPDLVDLFRRHKEASGQ